MSHTHQHEQNFLIRFIKGMFIGSGFIVPGVSGGALAAIFGIYERIIRFIADITHNFWKNVKFFIPVGLGALASIVLLSWGVSYLLGNYETIILWFFVGAIVGTAPALWQEAGAQGRDRLDIITMLGACVFGIVLLGYGQQLFQGGLTPSFAIWMLCGGLIALGILVPGLSPSNFIVYMGLYQTMADGFKTLDFGVIIPIGLGGLVTIILLAKVINYIFDHYYSRFFHFIVGVVAASTIMIIPTNYQGFSLGGYFACLLLFLLGGAIGLWMARLEAQFKS